MNNKFLLKRAIVTGLSVGVFTIVSFTVTDHFNQLFAWGILATTIRGLTGLLSLVILGIGVYTGTRGVKRSSGGTLTYGQAVLAGFTIALITGILTALAGFAYCNYINPGYPAYMLSESKNAMVADGRTPAEIAAAMPGQQWQWSVGGQMVQAFVGQTFCGTLISLVTAIFIKSKK